MFSFLSLSSKRKKASQNFTKMGDFVTVRNVSRVPLELKLVEHFDPSPENKFSMVNVTMSLASVTNSLGLTNDITRATMPHINPYATPFATREVSIHLEPFSVTKTDIHSYVKNDKERLRLTFQTPLGGKHQMYCPVPTAESASLVALAANPVMRFTGVYLTQHAWITLYPSSKLDSWMSKLPDRVPLGALSIPGTHNSPTCHTAPPSVRCQAVDPKTQLENGVRFFDLRVQVPAPFDPESDKLALVHSVFPISLTGNKYFRDLYDDIIDFLKAHPSETLVMSVKREGTGDGTDEQLSRILKRHYANPQQWFTKPRVPTLGEARGKIVLVRRFNIVEELKHEWGGKGWGIDAATWADNTPHAMCPSGDICVQDFYQVMEPPTIDKKIEYVEAQLERSGSCLYDSNTVEAADIDSGKKFPIFINFLSASNFWKVDTWPEKIAAKVNPGVVDWLCRRHMVKDDGLGVKDGDWSTGAVVCDWVGLDGDWDLAHCIVAMNNKLIRK